MEVPGQRHALGAQLAQLGARGPQQVDAPLVVVGGHAVLGHEQRPVGQLLGQAVQRVGQALDPRLGGVGRPAGELAGARHVDPTAVHDADQVGAVAQVGHLDLGEAGHAHDAVAQGRHQRAPRHVVPRPGAVPGGDRAVGGVDRPQVHRGGHGPGAAQLAPGVAPRQPRGVHRLGERLGIVAARRRQAPQVAVGRPPDGVEHREPAAHQIAHGLRRLVDEAGPVPAAGALVEQAALVLEPARLGHVVQRHPRRDAHGHQAGQPVALGLQRAGVQRARRRVHGGPVDHDAHVADAGVGQQHGVVAPARRAAVALAGGGRPPGPLPGGPVRRRRRAARADGRAGHAEDEPGSVVGGGGVGHRPRVRSGPAERPMVRMPACGRRGRPRRGCGSRFSRARGAAAAGAAAATGTPRRP